MGGVSSSVMRFGQWVINRWRWLKLARQHGVSLGNKVLIGADTHFAVTDDAKLEIADGASFAKHVMIFVKFGRLRIGRASHVGIGTVICARELVEIGDHVLIAEYVTIRDQDHDFRSDYPIAENGFNTSPIRIGSNVWIGAKATITRGVTIGDGAVIGANSVVTRDVPPNMLAVGTPVRIISEIKRNTLNL